MPVQQRKVKGTPSDIYESKDEGTANAQAGPAAVIAASPSASPWWLSATILGPICLILLILVIMMAQQVYQLSQKSEQQLEVTEMENIVLLDTLQQLTTGKGKELQLQPLRKKLHPSTSSSLSPLHPQLISPLPILLPISDPSLDPSLSSHSLPIFFSIFPSILIYSLCSRSLSDLSSFYCVHHHGNSVPTNSCLHLPITPVLRRWAITVPHS
ncbi:unnamed protein product [Lepidochelys olivacea]